MAELLRSRGGAWRRGGGEAEASFSAAEYYAACAAGGVLSAGATHLAITPFDVLKVHMQINPGKYDGVLSGLSTLLREEGASALWRGWSGKLLGYGCQGGCRFGLYEYFKGVYADALGGGGGGAVFAASSASAQVVADVVLCPFEAVKVRVQAQPAFARGLLDGFPKLYRIEGLPGFYRGLLPLWCRNLPFAMLMFSTFKHSVEFMYKEVIRRRKEECSRWQQLGVTCAAGYVAGSVGTVVSNPADNIISALYNKRADGMLQAVRSIGLRELTTRSLPLRFALVGPVITTQWFFYDSIKLLIGLPTSGGLGPDLRRVEDTT